MNKKFVFVYCNDISPIEDYVNSLRILEYISIYKQDIIQPNDSVYINYSESYSSTIDFPDLNLFEF